jgi:TetR/AcrR family transcriptional regulator
MPESANPPSERSAETRTRILESALAEFASMGLAGARTERIAAAAGVNKALLYYYFESKDKLYEAALEHSAARIRDVSMAVFLSQSTPGERIVRTALNHFDRIVGQREFQSLMQQEMIRLHTGESDSLGIIIKRLFSPLLTMFEAMVREGAASGELIQADWMQFHLSMLGANVFYFLSAPIFRRILPNDPLDVEMLRKRRKAIVEFLGQAIFVDRQHGAEIAARVLADTPMPAFEGDRLTLGRKE